MADQHTPIQALNTYHTQVTQELAHLPEKEVDVTILSLVIVTPAEGHETRHSAMAMAASNKPMSQEHIVEALAGIINNLYAVRAVGETPDAPNSN